MFGANDMDKLVVAMAALLAVLILILTAFAVYGVLTATGPIL